MPVDCRIRTRQGNGARNDRNAAQGQGEPKSLFSYRSSHTVSRGDIWSSTRATASKRSFRLLETRESNHFGAQGTVYLLRIVTWIFCSLAGPFTPYHMAILGPRRGPPHQNGRLDYWKLESRISETKKQSRNTDESLRRAGRLLPLAHCNLNLLFPYRSSRTALRCNCPYPHLLCRVTGRIAYVCGCMWCVCVCKMG